MLKDKINALKDKIVTEINGLKVIIVKKEVGKRLMGIK